jgi:hypothetical protein
VIPAARKFDAKKEVDTARAAFTSFFVACFPWGVFRGAFSVGRFPWGVFRGAFSVGGFSVDHTPAPLPM